MADAATKKSKRSAVGARPTGGAPGNINQAFDQAYKETLANDVRKRDTANIKNRGNLPRYGSAPVSSDVERLKAGVAPPAQQHGFDDAPAGNALMAKADAMLANLGSSRLRQAERNSTVALGAHPMTPNLAAAVAPTEREIAEAELAAIPGHNTLTPDAYRFRKTADFGAVAAGDATPEQLQRVKERSALMQGQAQYIANQAKRTGRPVDLAANAAAYDANRARNPADALALATGAHPNAVARYLRMTGREGQGATSTAPSQQYDPATSAMLGYFMGGPQLASEFARGAAGANSDHADREHTLAALRESQRHNMATEGGQFGALAAEREQRQQHHDEQMAAIKGQTDATLAAHKEKTPHEVVGAIVANGGDPDQYINFIRMTQGDEAAKAAAGGLGAQGGIRTSMTPKEIGTIATEAINQNLDNPHASFDEMIGSGIPADQAIAIINSHHPYVLRHPRMIYDPQAGKSPASSWHRAMGREPSLMSPIFDELVPWLGDISLPQAMEFAKRGMVPKTQPRAK